MRHEERHRTGRVAVSIFHFFTQRIKGTAGSRKGREGKRRTVRGEQRREFFAVWSNQHGEFRLCGCGRPDGFKAHIKRKAKFEDASLIDANKGSAVDVTGCGVFGFHQHAMTVPWGLEQRH